MSRKFRIDFSIRELNVPDEQAQGIRFGDDIELDSMPDFFDRCRDAARTLFVPTKKQRSEGELQDEISRLVKERERLKAEHRACATVLRDEIKKIMQEKDIKVLLPQAPAPVESRDPYRMKDWDYDERMRDLRRPEPHDPYAGKNKAELDRMDDGSRGGDGPFDPRYVAAYKAAKDEGGYPRY